MCFGHSQNKMEANHVVFRGKQSPTLPFLLPQIYHLSQQWDPHCRRKIGVGAEYSGEDVYPRVFGVVATTAASFADNIRSDERRKLEERRRPALCITR